MKKKVKALSKYVCTGYGVVCPFDRPCSVYTPMETDAPELPAVKTCLFFTDELITFRKIMRGEE